MEVIRGRGRVMVGKEKRGERDGGEGDGERGEA